MRRFKTTGVVSGLVVLAGLSAGGVLPPAIPLRAQEATPGATPAAMSASLHVAVARSLARYAGREYHIDANGRGTNPRHGLTLRFTPHGARIETSTPDTPRGTGHAGFTLRLARFGRGAGDAVRPAAPRIAGAWVEYDRGAGVREWFVNVPRGVEQGWTVAERPAGTGPLALVLDTGRRPDRVADGELRWAGLVYRGLVALDARGRQLPSRWVHDGGTLRIEVDDDGAIYPVVIDPWVQQAKLTAEDAAGGDLFGFSVAVEGDTALVGAQQASVGDNFGQGAVYVFTRSGGVWSEHQKLTAADGAASDFFGASVTLGGDTALVGAWGADVGDNENQGAAYVLTRSGGVWSEHQKLTAADGVTRDFFGTAVALDGDTALVGAASADAPGNPNQGAAYVFTRSGGVWSEHQKLAATDGGGSYSFGGAVALDGDTALVGASSPDSPGSAAYVFTRSGGVWSEHQKLTPTDGAIGDSFGISVALDGDTALVGAWAADVEGTFNQGAAYVFTRSGGTWSEHQKLRAADGAADDFFGVSVALEGDTAFVGAWEADVGDNEDQGAVYVFTRSGRVWSERQQLIAADGMGHGFGRSVALDGDTALVGAATLEASAEGAAYVFTVAEPALAFEPSALDFGDAVVGSTSGAMTATLQNAGTAAATGLTVNAPGNGFTVETSTCSDTLAPGDSCEISVTFTPPGPGPTSATLTVESAEGATATLTLSGTGIAPALTFEPTRLDFGEVDVGTTSAAMTATLRNTGSAAATDLTFGALAHGFSADTRACGVRLDAGARCEIRVVFTPAAAGPAIATLIVESVEEATAALTLIGAGVLRYDFAEGATGFFTTTLGLFNPDREAAATVEVTLLPEGGEPVVIPVTLPPFGRESLDVNAVVETPTGVAAVVRSDRPIAPLRQVSWDDRVYGSTLESGALGPSRTHYFAQGATTLWDLFYILSNDTETDVPVTIEYLRDVGEPVVQQVTVPARSRQTVWVNDVPRMALTRAGAIITSAVPIAAERSMYQKWPGWPAGSSSRGAHAPDDTWYFAEGATDFFDSYLVLMNPDRAREAMVDVRYHLGDGQTITKTHVVPPRSRRTIRVEAEDLALINQLTAMTVSANVPIVAERAVGWGPLSVLLPIPLLWYETTASVGSSATGTVWAIGEAWTGGPAAEDAYLLVANTAADPGQVRVTLVYDDGSSDAQEVPMAGHGRVTVLLGALFPASDGRRFSVLVESLGGDTAVPIVVDVSRYQSTDGRFANAGGSTTATRIR